MEHAEKAEVLETEETQEEIQEEIPEKEEIPPSISSTTAMAPVRALLMALPGPPTFSGRGRRW